MEETGLWPNSETLGARTLQVGLCIYIYMYIKSQYWGTGEGIVRARQGLMVISRACSGHHMGHGQWSKFLVMAVVAEYMGPVLKVH